MRCLLPLALAAALAACAEPPVTIPPPMAVGPAPLTAEQAAAFARSLPVYRSPEEMIAGGRAERAAFAPVVRQRREEEYCRSFARDVATASADLSDFRWAARRGEFTGERANFHRCMGSFERHRALTGR